MSMMDSRTYDVSEGTQFANQKGLAGMLILWSMLLALAGFTIWVYASAPTSTSFTSLVVKYGFLGWAEVAGLSTIPILCILGVVKTALEWPRVREVVVDDEGFTLTYNSGKQLHRSWKAKGLRFKIEDDRLVYPDALSAILLKIPWRPNAALSQEALNDLLERAKRNGVEVERKKDRDIDGTIAGEVLIFSRTRE
jgi:hypothetical protein